MSLAELTVPSRQAGTGKCLEWCGQLENYCNCAGHSVMYTYNGSILHILIRYRSEYSACTEERESDSGLSTGFGVGGA